MIMQAVDGRAGSPDRVCTSCAQTTPQVSFKRRGSTGRRAHTYHSMCNRCLYLRYTKPGAELKAAEIANFKLEQGCRDCGYAAHPAALEFDHLPGTDKLFNIGEQIGNRSRADLWAEIAKCEVVCANCHNIRTSTRREVLHVLN